ncbi:PfkB family carbohydrate kinase [Prosthecobacter sp. SYSU 5D2]|uniref:PfkB family carbohydrate kinase n=1 Tax=Prosthecobacter sp. SYSU 5D2 TaxID=3134134 RepID=UPI0031FE8E82
MTFPSAVLLSGADVVGIGAATLDDLWAVADFSDLEIVAPALAYVQMGGGPVATALCVMAALGNSAVLMDNVGDDLEGNSILQGLGMAGVSTQGMRLVPGARSARAVILVRGGDGARQIHYLPSTAGELHLDEEQVSLIRNARLLHLNGRHEQAARKAVKAAREAGVAVSFDGGAGRYREEIRDLVIASEIRILSLEFARCFCGTVNLEGMMQQLLAPPAKLVVLTDGVRGCHVRSSDGEAFHQPAFAASPLVDTTGCGDVFHGAFLHGWLQQWSLEKCAGFASRMAARNAEGLGGRHVLAGGQVAE